MTKLLPKTIRNRKKQALRDFNYRKSAALREIEQAEIKKNYLIEELVKRCPHSKVRNLSGQYMTPYTKCDICGGEKRSFDPDFILGD